MRWLTYTYINRHDLKKAFHTKNTLRRCSMESRPVYNTFGWLLREIFTIKNFKKSPVGKLILKIMLFIAKPRANFCIKEVWEISYVVFWDLSYIDLLRISIIEFLKSTYFYRSPMNRRFHWEIEGFWEVFYI